MTTPIAQRQPRSLYLLFFTELWERFGFYTVQTIIILYMTKALLMSDVQANLLYAAFSSLLYLTPTIGGYIADRYLGFQRAIMIGGFLFVIAYLLCAASEPSLFFTGLSLLICANGLFKPNVSSIIGDLYTQNDPRRDGGFTIFYMGINIGALIPPLIAGALVVKYGWHAGFLLAAVGMALGQIIFMFGRKYLGEAGAYPKASATKHSKPSFFFYFILTLGILLTVALCQIAFHHPIATNTGIGISTLFVLGIVLFYLFREKPAVRTNMFAAIILIVISTAFWALYNQAFTSLMLFADRNMSKQFLGFSFDAEATQFFNPFFIIVLSPLLSRIWFRMDNIGFNPSTQLKFFLGMFFMAAGYLILALAGKFFAVNGLVSPWWLCASYLLQTIAELLISPIGLAMITVLCPKNLVGMMMGVWFFAQAASFAIGGYLANFAAMPNEPNALISLPIYTNAFFIYTLMALVMTVISLFCVPFLNRMINK